jgi:hypothetical protein
VAEPLRPIGARYFDAPDHTLLPEDRLRGHGQQTTFKDMNHEFDYSSRHHPRQRACLTTRSTLRGIDGRDGRAMS